MGTAKNEFFRLPRKPANAHFIRVFGDAEKFFCTYLTQSDDLGRVVIPKEIRRTMRIREGDPLLTTLTPMERTWNALLQLAERAGAPE